jgi:hypothetical protein
MYYTKHVTLTGTTLTELFTVPNGYMVHIVYVFVANHDGTPNSIDVKWTDDADTPTDLMYIFDNTQVAANSNVTLGGQSEAPIFVLHQGEVVRVQAAGAGDMEVAVTFKLVEQPASLVNFNGS